MRFCFTQEAIVLEPLIDEVQQDKDGAVVSFLGVVRDHARGRRVERLHYEAFEAMAEHQMAKIFDEARARWQGLVARVVHRTGVVEIGQPSIAIVTASPHRAEAFDFCRFLIDRIKQTVPIWKKEFYADGEVWVGDRS